MNTIKNSKAINQINLLVLSIVLSVLISHGFFFLIWFHIAPLIYLFYSNSLKKSLLLAVIYSLFTSIFFFDWTYSAGANYNYKSIYLITIIIFAAFQMIFCILFLFLSPKLGDSIIFLAPSIWILIMFFYSFFNFNIYWMNYAIFQTNLYPLAAYLGGYGITFLIILFNSIIAYSFFKKKVFSIVSGLILAIIVIFFVYYSYSTDFTEGEKIRVALIQGNFSQSFDWRKENAFSKVLDTYINMSQEAIVSNASLIIWPEYAIPEDLSKNKTASERISKIIKNYNVTIILGSISYVDENNYYDTAKIFLPNGSVIDSHATITFFLDKKALPDKNLAKRNALNTSILICNEESSSPNIGTNSQFVIAMSNNQGLIRGKEIVAQFTKLIASENHKYVIRATNDGISQIINPAGRVISELEPEKRKILIGEIYKNNIETFYAKYPKLMVYVSSAFLIFFMIRRILN